MQVIRVPISMPTYGNSSGGRFYDPEIRAEISRRPKERITVQALLRALSSPQKRKV
jgi:hypothetical protein